MTGLFRVPPSRNASNTRLDTCVHEAKASGQPGVSLLLPRVHDGRNATGSGVPVSKNVPNTRSDTCMHEAGVSVDPEFKL